MLNRYALIGRNISHSKSPIVYKQLLKEDVDYTLLDFKLESDIPKLGELFQTYNRISITAPYKKFIYEQCDEVSKASEKLMAVNAIKNVHGNTIGTNTDFEAFQSLFFEYGFDKSEAIILGDGAMSRVAQLLFSEKSIPFKLLSRRIGNLDKLDQVISEIPEDLVLINTCSREYRLSFQSSKCLKVWDMNYSHSQNKDFCERGRHSYIDGEDLLFRQAQYALSFWNSLIS